jgi:C4-dicarboxylate-specific signal transduction histidine kinase
MTRDKSIHELLKKEVASKGPPAAYAFAAFAIVIYFYHFHIVDHVIPVQTATFAVLVASATRILISRQMVMNGAKPLYGSLIRVSIWLNTVSWSVIFSLSAYELQTTGVDYCVLITMMTGLVSASIVTLSYDKWLFMPFQVLLIFPAVAIAIEQWTREKTSGLLVLAFILTCCFLYQLKQYKEFRLQLLARLGYQVDLEESLNELQLSKNELVDKTVNLIQVSKASALGEMAGGLSHEVNNSLQFILGSIQQLERTLRNEVASLEVYDGRIKNIRDAITKIKTVVEGLRHFSQQMDLAPKELCSIEEIIDRSLNFSKEILRAYSVELIMGNIPKVKVSCHPTQLTQVIYNLIKNAFDAVQINGEGPKWIKIDFIIQDHKLNIYVINSGEKIIQEVVSKIFQPFFTTKEVGKGSGLSLSSSLGIAREHQGELFLDTSQKHTSFVLSLPVVLPIEV